MKTMIQTLRLGLVALLLTIAVQSVSAAPPRTGIRGQTLLQQSFSVEVSPGVFLGDTWWVSSPASFRVLSAHSGREVARITSDIFGSFQISLPPGKYVVVPVASPGAVPFTGSFAVTVTAKHFTDVSIVYGSVFPISP